MKSRAIKVRRAGITYTVHAVALAPEGAHSVLITLRDGGQLIRYRHQVHPCLSFDLRKPAQEPTYLFSNAVRPYRKPNTKCKECRNFYHPERE